MDYVRPADDQPNISRPSTSLNSKQINEGLIYALGLTTLFWGTVGFFTIRKLRQRHKTHR